MRKACRQSGVCHPNYTTPHSTRGYSYRTLAARNRGASLIGIFLTIVLMVVGEHKVIIRLAPSKRQRDAQKSSQ